MAIYDSPTLDSTVTSVIVRDVSADITLMTLKSPLLDMLMAGKERVYSGRVEWHDNAMRPKYVTLGSAETGTSGDTTLLITGNQTGWMRANMFLRSRTTGEIVHVTTVGAYDTTGNTTSLTVTRGYTHTSPTELGVSTVLDVVGTAALEGATFAATISNSYAKRTNFTHIFSEGITVTGTELATMGVNGILGTQYADKERLAMEEVRQSLARWIYVGGVPASTAQGSATVARTFDGIDGQIAAGLTLGTNAHRVDISGADFNSTDAVDNLMTYISLVEEYGGKVTHIFVNRRVAAQLTKDGGSGIATRNVDGADKLWRVIKEVETFYGTAQVVYDPAAPIDGLYLLDLSKITLLELRPFTIVPMGVTGDARSYLLVGEYSLRVKDAFRGGHFAGYKCAA